MFGQSVVSSDQRNIDMLGAGAWEGQGDWVEDWGEIYSGKRRPALFVANVERYIDVFFKLCVRKLDYKGTTNFNEQGKR
jgi:hypothetical protein